MELEHRIATGQATTSPSGNTTLTLLVTNQKLDTHALKQLARQVHSSLARAIGLLASELAWDAILRIYE